MDATIIAGLVSALATIVGAIVAALAKRSTIFKLKGIELEFSKTNDPIIDSRIPDARDALTRQESLAKWYSRADSSLTFGQYIVGGVLASSFIQQVIASQLIGVLGVLVLLSSLIRQRYRPDLSADGARSRVVLLRSLIREVEDDLYALKSNHDGAPTIYSIRQKVSSNLSKIEESELVDIKQETKKPKST